MFKITWINYGELDYSSKDFCKLDYDISNHTIFYETCNGIKHALRCDFGSIFDKLRSIVISDEFQNEKPYEDGCDGDWYKFEYTLNGKEVQYEGYIYGLRQHELVISLIESCAKDILDDERKLLEHKDTDNYYWVEEDWVQDIIQKRQKLEEDFLDFWEDISSTVQEIPDGFIMCNNCKSIVHNKYYKNRKYWGRVWLSDEFGDYEVEYDSGECPVCGQLNNELPYTGLDLLEDDLFDSSGGAVCITAFEENKDKLYSASELNDLLKYISEDDRSRIEGCQFKLFENALDDDSGDVYYYITIFKDDTEIGKIDMQYHSNTYFDLIDMEIKTTDATPYYTYEMTLYEDSKEESKNIKNPFDDSKLRCKKCGKIFCSCNTFFSSRT